MLISWCNQSVTPRPRAVFFYCGQIELTMTAGNSNNRQNLPRVQGSRVPGAHPGDTVIRRDRYPYAAPSPVENLLYWLTGSPIATSQALHERLSKLKALAVFSSDALSSVAYATEEILLVLVLA